MKYIMLAVTGLSPQVITETLYALHQDMRRIDEIHVITTRSGKEKIFGELLAGDTGPYFQYLNDYDIDPHAIDFGHHSIHMVTDAYGNEIADIVTESDNEQLLKACLKLTFCFTHDPDTAVFFSISGGRKTMSSCLTLAAQMYGRPQDRLYHVLVSPEFESNRAFYYPPKASCSIQLKDAQGQPYYKDTRYAKINLIHIPFFSIRNYLTEDLLHRPKDPATLMLSLIREEKSRLTVNLLAGKLIYKTLEMDMMPAHLALYAFFAMQKKNCHKCEDACGACTDCFMDIQTVFERHQDLSDVYRKINGTGTRPLEEMSDTGITCLSASNFNMYKGKIRKLLLTAFGPFALQQLEIASIGKRPNTRYGIRLNKSDIELTY